MTGRADTLPLTAGNSLRVRILATSDLHMQLRSFDYVKSIPNDAPSLAKLATLIHAERDKAKKEGDVCLLVDNGDTWQGTPLADYIARDHKKIPHPLAEAMNYLKYDAIGIGNHDFDFGTDYLSGCLAQVSASVICSNIHGTVPPNIHDATLIDKDVILNDGTTHTLRVGILATAPDLTNTWNRHHLSGNIWFSRPLSRLQDAALQLRANGAEIILVLAHMGFATSGQDGPRSQNVLSQVAAISDIDAVVGGHTHERFPKGSVDASSKSDTSDGLVHGTPVVQPGASGSDLGRIFLSLRHTTDGKWQTKAGASDLLQSGTDILEDRDVLRMTQSTHEETCSFLDQQAGRLANPMHTYFALAQPSPVQGLLAAAKKHAIRKAVEGTPYADLPLLAVASATLTGGLDGPENFISLDKGEIKYRHIAGLTPYANQVWAVKTNDARILDWLERSALIFNTLIPDRPDQLLINEDVPGFRYDAIFGLNYEIDPREPPLFDGAGKQIPGRKGRIASVTWQDRPLEPNQEFLVATTDHRVGGGGIYEPFDSEDIVVQGHAPLQAALLKYLENPSCDEVRSAKPWRLKAGMGLSAILLSAPEAAKKFDEVRSWAPEDCGVTEDGFLKVRLHL